MEDIKKNLYAAAVEELLEHEFDIKRKSNEKEFSYEIQSNFEVEYFISMSWFFGRFRKSVNVGRITAKQVLEKLSKLKDFRHLRSYDSEDNDEIVRVICASYAMWKLGIKVNFGGKRRIKDEFTGENSSADEAWEKLFKLNTAPEKSVKTLLVEAEEEPINARWNDNPIEAITFNF